MRTHDDGKSLQDFVTFHGKEQLVQSLREAHDCILYDSNIKIGERRKDLLHDLKLLADHIEGQ